MRDLLWRLCLTLLALLGLGAVGLDTSLGATHVWVERLTGETPHAHLDVFLRAVREGDAEASLACWARNPHLGPTFEARRARVVADLLAFGPRLSYRVQAVEWWRMVQPGSPQTCCEPDVVEDAAEADGARLWVVISSENRAETVYVVDLLVPGGYWGEAAGNPVRRWQIVDVYPAGEPSLAFPIQAAVEGP